MPIPLKQRKRSSYSVLKFTDLGEAELKIARFWLAKDDPYPRSAAMLADVIWPGHRLGVTASSKSADAVLRRLKCMRKLDDGDWQYTSQV
jgi:hypothetical protein